MQWTREEEEEGLQERRREGEHEQGIRDKGNGGLHHTPNKPHLIYHYTVQLYCKNVNFIDHREPRLKFENKICASQCAGVTIIPPSTPDTMVNANILNEIWGTLKFMTVNIQGAWEVNRKS